MENNNMQRELDWNDEIQQDNEFQLLPEGDYNFEVLSFERGRHNGSDKLPPCPKATLKLKVWSDAGQTVLNHNLFLHSTCEGMLCAFFTSIGQRAHGQRISMNWSAVPGSGGRCKLGTRKWVKRDTGEEMTSNQIVRFYDPKEQASASYSAGRF